MTEVEAAAAGFELNTNQVPGSARPGGGKRECIHPRNTDIVAAMNTDTHCERAYTHLTCRFFTLRLYDTSRLDVEILANTGVVDENYIDEDVFAWLIKNDYQSEVRCKIVCACIGKFCQKVTQGVRADICFILS